MNAEKLQTVLKMAALFLVLTLVWAMINPLFTESCGTSIAVGMVLSVGCMVVLSFLRQAVAIKVSEAACRRWFQNFPESNPPDCKNGLAAEGIVVSEELVSRVYAEVREARTRKEREREETKLAAERKAAENATLRNELTDISSRTAAEKIMDLLLKLKIVLDLGGVSQESYREQLANIVFEETKNWSPRFSQTHLVSTRYFADIVRDYRAALDTWNTAVEMQASIDPRHATFIGGGFGVKGALIGMGAAAVFNSVAEGAAARRCKSGMDKVAQKMAVAVNYWRSAADKIQVIQAAMSASE